MMKKNPMGTIEKWHPQKNNLDNPYRKLQQHLDKQPVGFPATSSGAEIRILQHIFTPEQADIATCLTHRPEPLATVYDRAKNKVPSLQSLETQLDSMLKKGGIEIQRNEDQIFYANTPLVVGMYELQIDRLTPEFIANFKTYSADKNFGLSFIGTRLPQMRTIPIKKSIQSHTHVSTFDEINTLLQKARGPFVILACICREKKALQGISCKVTQRKETCMALGNIAESVLEMGVGRKISREEAMAIMDENQKEGLVLQPANAKTPDFICSCCGCCCGMLDIQKSLPVPVNFWASNFQAVIDPTTCIGCGICNKRCQADAILIPPLSKKKENQNKNRIAAVDKKRCIGCGVCVPTCPTHAITLTPRPDKTQPPDTRQELYEILLAGKKDRLARVKLYGKLARDIILTRDLRLLK
jgi:ferredoxin